MLTVDDHGRWTDADGGGQLQSVNTDTLAATLGDMGFFWQMYTPPYIILLIRTFLTLEGIAGQVRHAQHMPHAHGMRMSMHTHSHDPWP